MKTFDVIAYLEDKGIEIVYSGKNVSSSGGWIGIQCPFCGDNSSHGGINLISKAYSCFRCGGGTEKRSVLDLIQMLESCSKSKAWEITRKYQNLDSFHEEKEIIRASKIEMPSGVSKEFPDVHIEYLKKRGFDPKQVIDKYDLYAGKYTGFFKHRIVIPVYLNDQMVTLVGRDISGLADEPYKAWPSEQSKLSTKETLYNIDSIRKNVIIVEGILDVWRIGDGAVATFGTKFTPKQLMLLKGIEKAFVMYDAEAQKEAHKLAASLYGLVGCIEIMELSHGDPCDLTQYEVEELRKDIGL